MGSSLHTITDDHKRWLVFGIALNHVLVPSIRPFLEQEMLIEYNNLKSSHNVHVQSSHSFPAPRYPTSLKYENINSNDAKLKPPHYKKYDYATFDYKVTSNVDFAKLFLQSYMAKFNAFDKTCDASAVVNLLGKVPAFPTAVQSAANVVREDRNAWAHCVFTNWNDRDFQQKFDDMEQLVKVLGLTRDDESKILTDLDDWKNKGTILCINATVDSDLVELMQQRVCELITEVEDVTNEISAEKETMNNVKSTLHNVQLYLRDCEQRFVKIENEQKIQKQEHKILKREHEVTKQEQNVLKQKHKILKQEHEVIKEEQSSASVQLEVVQQRVADLEDQHKSSISHVSPECASCEADINFLTKLYDPGTRQWLLADFDKWFSDPGNSRAYVLLGDAAVGKSVMAAVIAERARDAGHLAAAYFCRHYDGTRRDPRYLLGTIAHQLCNCNSEYNTQVGGDAGIQRMLANSKLGVHELATKLLEEPLAICKPSNQRMVVIVDALDETEYWSRNDFLDLIMRRFPQLPEWLVFFITSRPEDTVQSRLKRYNPCIRICAGNSDTLNFYQKHEQDIRLFLEKRVDFSVFSFSAEDLTKNCNGMFLYAFYIVEILKNPVKEGKMDKDIFPGDINDFFLKNFKRIFDKVGENFYRKMFGCALVAPSPLPVSFISFILQRENLDLDEQEVIDAVSQFVVLRTSNQTFTFLHNLIPSYLTDENKVSRRMFIDRNKATEYFRNTVVEILNTFINDESNNLSDIETDVVDYVLRFGVSFLCDRGAKDSLCSETVFKCLTNYQFIQRRIQSSKIGIYSLIEDLKLSAVNQACVTKREILQDTCLALERDVYVVLQCPQLLHFCFRNSSKIVQENIIIPNNVTATWLESSSVPVYPASVSEIVRDTTCLAFSHDKKLLAGGKERCIFLFDAGSFDIVLGPIEVINQGYISHLEFSPDDNFIFFGRLDKWYSVPTKRLIGLDQFSGRSQCYNWGSLIFDGKFIVVRDIRFSKHKRDCFINLLFYWAIMESVQDDPRFDLVKIQCDYHLQTIDEFLYKYLAVIRTSVLPNDLEFLVGRLFGSIKEENLLVCEDCSEFKMKHQKQSLSLVRDRIIDLYSDLFTYQVWNVQTGRPVLEDMFSSAAQSNSFLYFCHFFPAIKGRESIICDESLSFSAIALMNTLLHLRLHVGMESPDEEGPTFSFSPPTKRPDPFSYFVKSTPAQFYNHIMDDKMLSQDGEWLACYLNGRLELFKKSLSATERNPVYVIDRAEKFAFTDDSSVLVYTTPAPDQQVHALVLQSGTKLLSGSVLKPLCCTSEKEVRYIFYGSGEKRIVLAKYLSNFFRLNNLIRKPVVVTFTSNDKIMCLSSDGAYTSWGVQEPVLFSTFDAGSLPTSQKTIKTCAFSSDGKLTAIYIGSKVLLFHECSEYLCSISNRELEECTSISCLIFSPDCSLLLYGNQQSNGVQSFYVWDVQKEVISPCSKLPSKIPSIDCCCFSSDNKKLIVLGKAVIEIWNYPWGNAPLRTLDLYPHFQFDTFSDCTVSSNNELLACCITNMIFIYPLNNLREHGVWQVPHGHLGRVDFCRFLKGNRYLLSVGVDGAVFLFDVSEWKTIAYARISNGDEYIVSMAVSPSEDKVIFLKSNGRLVMMKLCGLQDMTPLKYSWPEERYMQTTSQPTPPVQTSDSSKISKAMIEEMDFMLPSDNSDDSDE